VASVGDVNGDGVDDILTSVPFLRAPSGDGAGRAYVLFGRDSLSRQSFPTLLSVSDLDGIDGFAVTNMDTIPGVLGFSVAGAGDIDGDSLDDVAMSELLGIGGPSDPLAATETPRVLSPSPHPSFQGELSGTSQ